MKGIRRKQHGNRQTALSAVYRSIFTLLSIEGGEKIYAPQNGTRISILEIKKIIDGSVE
ncbi:hypothetical protein [Clostridium polynesiense]|uniref:hypothetical protein n=1 Tax=Clostridium polynesiense TaxID=1325933 RepID=UPI000A89471A|nr:hypothetical protein [Clostridium polynesiense]